MFYGHFLVADKKWIDGDYLISILILDKNERKQAMHLVSFESDFQRIYVINSEILILPTVHVSRNLV